MTKRKDQQEENGAQAFSIPLNKYSSAALTAIRQHTGLDIPGAVRFALVIAGGLLRFPLANNAIRDAAYRLAIQDGRNEVPNK